MIKLNQIILTCLSLNPDENELNPTLISYPTIDKSSPACPWNGLISFLTLKLIFEPS